MDTETEMVCAGCGRPITAEENYVPVMRSRDREYVHVDDDKNPCSEKYNRRMDRIEQLVEQIRALIEHTNDISAESSKEVTEAFLRAMLSQHRTLQQNFMRALREALRQYGETSTDLRNEGAVTWARRAAMVDTYMPYV
jgi:hypothetical protein